MSTVHFGGEELGPDTESVALVNVEWPDLAPLTGLVHLRTLELTHTNPHVSPGGMPVDIAPLAQLGALEVLVLQHYPLESTEPLRELRALRVLDLAHAPVSDLGPLAGLRELRELRLRATRVADLSPLSSLEQLEALDVAHTRVSSLRPLHGLPALRRVDVEGSAVPPSEVAALTRAVLDVTVTT
ncbi:internalin A [Georgenia satyanarayanai]|uniref:Internalin A n=1 Tax=Georgenia satyanarayanai TaxID=860221 RepID=A0A2Y9A3V5_9MICO|nr:leucine-rich repeat domain-containing protein [Georgenia satyanarayanai]PYG02337.1 internalin A [Georgenia satyanarayanai]SSA37209.1 internalin A [Georgenia satyanarayanai]